MLTSGGGGRIPVVAFSNGEGGSTTTGGARVLIFGAGTPETFAEMFEMFNGSPAMLGGIAPEAFCTTTAVEELNVVMLLRVLLSTVMLPELDTVVVLLIVVFTTGVSEVVAAFAYRFLFPRNFLSLLNTLSSSSIR